MGMFNEKVIGQTQEILGEMKAPVELLHFSQETECPQCASASGFVEELASLEGKLLVERKDLVADRDLAASLGVHHIPAIFLRRAGESRYPVRYYGIPSGYEFGAFLRTLTLFSTGETAESIVPGMVEAIAGEVTLRTFVLTTCPSCPVMVYLANTLAFLSPKVTTEIVEVNSFVDLSVRYQVSSVPKIVINDKEEVVGVLPPEELLRRITALF